jgi:tetratricopeptide (TPR) repeat protein
MELYRRALALDPGNFRLAAEVAQTYYGITVPKDDDAEARRLAERNLAEEAMAAWRTALKLADNDLERGSVHLHLTRWYINRGQFDDAHQALNLVTNEALAPSKKTLTRRLSEKEKEQEKGKENEKAKVKDGQPGNAPASVP